MSHISEQVIPLYREGLFLIPVHETGKNPLYKYSQEGKPDPIKLMDLMDRARTTAIAMVLGEKGSRVACIDIDTKYKAGFDAIIFKDLKEIYPDLWEKFRVEKTPSGGYHLIYRIEDCLEPLPSSYGLANRLSVEDELIQNPGKKTKCFLEIKCEGGLTQCWPSPGYVRVKGDLIQEFTWEEHMSLLYLCKSYNEVIKQDKPKPTKDFIDYYETDPYSDFDRSPEGSEVLKDNGWSYNKTVGEYDWYKKPNGKGSDTHATFNIHKRFYKIHATSAGIDDVSYTPSSLLATFKFDGNKKEVREHLIANGYGKIKPKIEERKAKRAAREGGELPKNFSEEGKRIYEEEKAKVQEKYPYGIFWSEDDNGNIIISRDDIINVSNELGFRIMGEEDAEIVYLKDYWCERVSNRFYFDRIKTYIGTDEETFKQIKDVYEVFVQKSGKATIERLEILDPGLFLKQEKAVGYKYFRNGVLKITEDEISLIPYSEIDGVIWKKLVQDRDFIVGDSEKGLYYDFLSKACRVSEHLFQCIGYYAHEYKSTSTPYIVILCEEVEDSKKGGGAGKNIFTNLFHYTTTLLNKPGRNVKFDDTLLRIWKDQRIMSLNDLDKKFDFLGLKELSSGKGEVGRKFQQEKTIDNSKMPKFICNTNYHFDPSAPGLKRRLIPLEFTDFFIKLGGVDKYYKINFPSDDDSAHGWSETDWIGFDNMIVRCIQAFMKNDCKLGVPELSGGGWKKQFDGKYNQQTFNFIEQNIDDWCELGRVEIDKVFNPAYRNYCDTNNVGLPFRLSSIKMNEALEEYCDKHQIDFLKYKNLGKINGIQTTAKIFKRRTDGEGISEIELEDAPF